MHIVVIVQATCQMPNSPTSLAAYWLRSSFYRGTLSKLCMLCPFYSIIRVFILSSPDLCQNNLRNPPPPPKKNRWVSGRPIILVFYKQTSWPTSDVLLNFDSIKRSTIVMCVRDDTQNVCIVEYWRDRLVSGDSSYVDWQRVFVRPQKCFVCYRYNSTTCLQRRHYFLPVNTDNGLDDDSK